MEDLTESEPAGPAERLPTETSPEPPPVKSGPKKAAPQKSARRSGGMATLLLWVLVLLAAMAAGGSAWLALQGQQRLAVFQTELEKIDSSAAARDSNTKRLQAAQSELDSRLAKVQKQQAGDMLSVRQSLSEHRRRLAEMATTDRDDWLLAEAEYLLRLANHRLLMGGDTAASAALLQAADDIVRELDGIALHDIRLAIANDMAALRASGRLDTQGTWTRLEALGAQVDRLAMFTLPEPAPATRSEDAAAGWRDRLLSGFRGALDKLSQYVVIRRREEVYEPMLSPEHEQLARQNLRLMLEQAQSALLSHNPDLYSASLDKASRWLSEYFTLSESGARSILTEIDALIKVQVTSELPDISGSLLVLKSHIETNHSNPVTRLPSPAKPDEAEPDVVETVTTKGAP
ncbi:MAG: uroporphyrin-3 C-methyltransferase [Halieaceae bacterium]